MAMEVHDLDFWSYAEFAKDGFAKLWPGIDPEASLFIMMLHRASDLMLFDVRQIEEDYGLSPVGQRVLYVLAVCGPLPMLRVAELTGMSKAACTSCVRTLAAEGYVSRKKSGRDARSIIIEASENGLRVAESTFRERNVREARWHKVLNESERKQFREVIDALMLYAGKNASRRDSIY